MVDKLPDKVGPWVTGDEFFDRAPGLSRLAQLLDDRNNILLVAPRRIGKTSLVRETFALIHKGDSLGELTRLEEAAAAYEEVVHRFGQIKDDLLLGNVLKSLARRSRLFYLYGFGSVSERAVSAAETAVRLRPRDYNSRYALASVYSSAGRWKEALRQIVLLLNDEISVETHVDDMINLLIDTAADGQAERVLEALSGTAAEQAMEPVVVALKELTGEACRVPQEIEEVKNDVLVKIEEHADCLQSGRVQVLLLQQRPSPHPRPRQKGRG